MSGNADLVIESGKYKYQRDLLIDSLNRLEVAANTVAGCYTRNPGNFASALRALQEEAAVARALRLSLEARDK